MSETELWKEKIKWRLELSKAFRSFVVLSIAILTVAFGWPLIVLPGWFASFVLFRVETGRLWTALKTFIFGITSFGLFAAVLLQVLERPTKLGWASAIVLVIIVVISAVGYVLLRINHMVILYQLAKGLECHEHGETYSAGQQVLPVRRVLVWADEKWVTKERLEKIDFFVQSIAPMNVIIFTMRSPPERRPNCPKQVYQVYLHKRLIDDEERKELPRLAKTPVLSEELEAPVPDLSKELQAPVAEFDLLIVYVNTDQEPPAKQLTTLQTKLRGLAAREL